MEQPWEALPEALRAVGDVEQVEIKAIVDGELESALAILDTEVGLPQLRRVHYLDTCDLALHRRGVSVRARVTDAARLDADDVEDVLVRLRGPAAAAPPRSAEVAIELDALPVEVTWAASMKRPLSPGRIDRALARRNPVRSLLKKKQRSLLDGLSGDGIDTDELAVFGPVDVVRLTSGPPGDRVGIEAWGLPDGSQIVELFAKCAPELSGAMAARIRDLIDAAGITLARDQRTKTHVSLNRLARARRSA